MATQASTTEAPSLIQTVSDHTVLGGQPYMRIKAHGLLAFIGRQLAPNDRIGYHMLDNGDLCIETADMDHRELRQAVHDAITEALEEALRRHTSAQ